MINNNNNFKMKFIETLSLFTLIVTTVKSAWWAAATQPVILTPGAVLGALNFDVLDVEPITTWKVYIPTFNKNLNR